MGTAEDVVCFGIEAAGNLTLREAALKQWISDARVRCGVHPPTSSVGLGGQPP